jgi:hypothetical protein
MNRMIRRSFLASSLLGTLAMGGLSGCVVREAPAPVVVAPAPPPPPPGDVVVDGPPPADVVEVQPPAPGPDFVWMGGSYVWFNGGWVWHHGYYRRPPYGYHYWVRDHWVRGPYGYRRVYGHWG